MRDRRANWEQSLATLRAAKAAGACITKTSIMLGCGESPTEVVAAMQELHDNGEHIMLICSCEVCGFMHHVHDIASGKTDQGLCPEPSYRQLTLVWHHAGVDVVTLGQYMRPTKRHMPVVEFVTPEAFAGYETSAKNMGFLYAAAGPMVRSSYRAGEFYLSNVLRKQSQEEAAAG